MIVSFCYLKFFGMHFHIFTLFSCSIDGDVDAFSLLFQLSSTLFMCLLLN